MAGCGGGGGTGLLGGGWMLASFIWTSHPTTFSILPTSAHTTTGSLRLMDRRNLINTPDKNQISHISKTTQRNQSTQLSNQDISNQSYFKNT